MQAQLRSQTNATHRLGVARVGVQSVERWVSLDEDDGAGALLAGFLEAREHLVPLSQACINQWNRLSHIGAPPRKLQQFGQPLFRFFIPPGYTVDIP